MALNSQYDYIIVGAGVIGSATAYYLKKTNPTAKILLIERFNRPGAGNTAKSAALFRNIFSSATNRILANSSIKFYSQISQEISMKTIGYLWLFSTNQWQKIRPIVTALDNKNLDLEILDQQKILDLIKINPTGLKNFQDVNHAIYGHQCGAFSAMAIAQYYSDEYQALGGETIFETTIRKISLAGKENQYAPWLNIKISNIKDSNHRSYEAKEYIFCVGADTQALLTPIGIMPAIYPKKRQLFGIKPSDIGLIFQQRPQIQSPAIILPTAGVYIKPILDRKMLVIGCADNLGQPALIDDKDPSLEYFQQVIRPVLLHYFPQLLDYTVPLKWAGYYDYHWPDNTPVIEQVANCTWIAGSSGSGIMKADAIGRIAAAKLTNQEFAVLYDGSKFLVSKLSLQARNVEKEELVI